MREGKEVIALLDLSTRGWGEPQQRLASGFRISMEATEVVLLDLCFEALDACWLVASGF